VFEEENGMATKSTHPPEAVAPPAEVEPVQVGERRLWSAEVNHPTQTESTNL